MNQPINKILILKYLKGECNPDELKLMDTFLLREDAQQFIDQVWAEEWTVFKENEISDQEISRWKDRFFRERLLSDPNPNRILFPVKRLLSMRYAAVWLALMLIIGTVYGVLSFKNRMEKQAMEVAMLETVNPYGQRSTIRLSDSTVVYLAAGSKLIYPDLFVGSTREITLEGEAFFEVTKNPKKPFIIHTGDIRTRVLGTSFRINAFKNQPLVVEVATGKVRVDQHEASRQTAVATLTPGQRLIWDNKRAVVETVQVDDVKEWKNGRLVFNGATLKELATVLERRYNMKIIFTDPGKAKLHITITLTANVPLTQMMEVLSNTVKFSYKLKGRQLIIN